MRWEYCDLSIHKFHSDSKIADKMRLPEIEDQDGIKGLVRLIDKIAIHDAIGRHDPEWG